MLPPPPEVGCPRLPPYQLRGTKFELIRDTIGELTPTDLGWYRRDLRSLRTLTEPVLDRVTPASFLVAAQPDGML